MSDDFFQLQKNNILQGSLDDIIELAVNSSKDLLSFLTVDNEMEFEDGFYTLCMMCNIGLSNKSDFTEKEKALIDAVFSQYLEADSSCMYPAFVSEVSDTHINLLNQLNSLGQQVLFPLMDLILCFSCINGEMDPNKSELLENIYKTIDLSK